MVIKYPDYNNCLTGITQSVLKHFGVKSTGEALDIMDEKLKKGYKNVVIILMDAMGSSIMDIHFKGSDFLIKHKQCNISSVFPPTTTAATASLLSGLCPAEHGWLGWDMYFKELDRNVCALESSFGFGERQDSEGQKAVADALQYKNVLVSIAEATKGQVRTESVFPQSGIKTTAQMCSVIKSLCEKEGRAFIGAYWHEPDALMHRLGTTHEKVNEQLHMFNSQIEELCAELKDTLVIVTADHGMVDVEYKSLENYPEIMDCLKRPIAIEARAVAFYIKKGREADFEKAFSASFGKDFILLSKEQAIKQKLFGTGKIHPRTEGFIGDYIAVAVSNIAITDKAGENRAHHSGLTEGEMTVPLIIMECPA